MNYSSPTFRLIKNKRNFREGLGSLLDFSTSEDKYRISDTPAQADRDSLLSDWQAVGEDMRYALDQYGKEIKQ
jgi:hypothetical protein